MQATIAKWGNSLALRLPREIARTVRLTEGESVALSIEGEALVIRPTRKRFKLSELLLDYDKSTASTSEVDWGKPEGDEIW